MPQRSEMDLQKELGAVAQMVREKTPPHVMPTIEATTKRLKESRLEDHALQTGQTMPDFELPDATGEIVRSVDLRSQGPLLITFYRGSWCPFCNLALRALQERNAEIKTRGVTLLAISPQTPDHSLTLQEKHSLQFPVLSDEGNRVARQFGIVFALDPGLKTVQEQFGVDIPAHNGDRTFELPVPATFLVSTDGKVLKSYAEADYMQRLDPETALDWIREL
jgi:peroxiredoxin